ncbi:MAG: large-conductance mechanosensitive channel protein MscL [Saprospiraceae bacterium]
MKKFIQDFKEFAVKGNLIDLAIGIIIGTAFNKIVSSLVNHIIMPPFGLVFGEKGLAQYKWIIRPGEKEANGEWLKEPVVMDYGIFLQNCIDFLIVALSIFVVIRLFNRLRNKAEDEKETTVPTPKDIQLMSEMRDLMQKQTEHLEALVKKE